MDLTTCRVDPALDAQYPASWPARVEITLAGGRTLSAYTQHAKGDPRNPLSQDEVIAKHRSIVAGIVDEQTDDAILDFILRLETKADFAELTRVLKGSCCRDGSGGNAPVHSAAAWIKAITHLSARTPNSQPSRWERVRQLPGL
jgi:hypothetical protein